MRLHSYRGIHYLPLTYYGIDSVEDPEQLAMYIYGEIIDRVTLETKSDHNLKNMDFNKFELDEAKAITRKFLSVLPEHMKERLCKRLDPETGLILDKGDFASRFYIGSNGLGPFGSFSEDSPMAREAERPVRSPAYPQSDGFPCSLP